LIYIYKTLTIKRKDFGLYTVSPSHQRRKRERERGEKKKGNLETETEVAARSEWVASDRRGSMGGWVSS